MNSPSLFFASIMILMFFFYYGYLPWFRPKKYIELYQNKRRSINKIFPYLPQGIVSKFFEKNPKIDLLWARVISMLGILFGIIGVIASIWSPYVK